MPLRRDGAGALDPRAKVWKWEENLLVGTFDLWLCGDPDHPHTWLVATVGLWNEPQLFDEEPAADLAHFDFTPHHPLLFLPRSPVPATFTARTSDAEGLRRTRELTMVVGPPDLDQGTGPVIRGRGRSSSCRLLRTRSCGCGSTMRNAGGRERPVAGICHGGGRCGDRGAV